MHLSINIIGDAFADIYCYLDADMPRHGGDARLVQPMHKVAGGSALNTATHLSSLLAHFWTNESEENLRTSNVNLQTVINENDEYGRMLASHCSRHNFVLINRRVSNHPSCYFGTDEAVSQPQKGDKSTGHCAVIVSKGNRSFMTHLGCMEDFCGSQILTNFQDLNHDKRGRQHVHVAGFYNIPGFWDGELAGKLAEIRQIQVNRNQRTTISLVPQHDATEQWDGGLLDILQYLDFLILSDEEASNITKFPNGVPEDGNYSTFLQHVAKFFCNNPHTYVIVTLGPKGAVAFCEGKVINDQKTYPKDNPVDPTGAGDAFAAGFLHGYLSHEAESNSEAASVISIDAVKAGMQWACATGTCCVTVQGASIPSKRESIEHMFNAIASK